MPSRRYDFGGSRRGRAAASSACTGGPLLADRGLPTALQAQARKATLPVTIEADGVGRYSQDTEAALYFCILEALQNIQKYAQASSAVVRLREDGDRLSVEVADDGRGFDGATTTRGNGLTNMEDRLDALGGTLHIASSPGKGTTLRATIPFASARPIKNWPRRRGTACRRRLCAWRTAKRTECRHLQRLPAAPRR